MEGAG